MAVPFGKVLLQELTQVDERRSQILKTPRPAINPEHAPETQALKRDLAGMGISGGGIRSATFNLGLLQGLAEHGVLHQLDYLSTVSGGGYIGSWLHGVIKRLHGGRPDQAEEELSPASNPIPRAPADDPISFLRKYSNYLAPRPSLLSPDVWVIAAIWVRNIFLNWCVLIPFLAALLLLPVAGGLAQQALDTDTDHERLLELSFSPALVLLSLAVIIMGKRLREIAQRTFPDQRSGRRESQPGIGRRPKADAGFCAVFVFLAAVLMGATRTNPLNWYWWALTVGAVALLVLFLVLTVQGGFLKCYGARRHHAAGALAWALLFSVVCAAVTAALLIAILRWPGSWQGTEGAWAAMTLGPVLVIAALSVGVSLLLGLMGADYPDAAREWVSRLGAILGIWSVAWMAIFALGVYSPLWVALAFAKWWTAAVTAAGGWVATSAAGILSASSSKTDGASSSPGGGSRGLDLIAKIAPVIFMTGFLVLISFGLHWGIREFADRNQPSQVLVPAGAPEWTSRIIPNHWASLEPHGWLLLAIIGALAGFALVSLALAVRININEFSMHHFYKNRLVRCYLGASQGRKRRPNPTTGFDSQDDILLRDLSIEHGYYGPYPIVNTTVNLNRGSELAKQERKAGSFVFTPKFCGFTPEESDADVRAVKANADLSKDGYCSTEIFTGNDGPDLGTAMAISGAAANPNMGYHTSAPVAFLLTIFNVRLGWWVGNPRHLKASRRPGPLLSLRYLIKELAGQTDDRSAYLNLSDGGHFDNIGLYELVRRRCRFIIIGDAEQDAGLTFGALAGAIRKCQTDFGVTIDIDTHSIQGTNELSRAHYAMGTIHYPETDPDGKADSDFGTGLLLYFKASLTGDEPEDVREYRARFSTFPHQSTADQFFTESQFESYRVLGLHIARTALKSVDAREPLSNLFVQLGGSWRASAARAATTSL